MLRTDWGALTDGERRKWALDHGPLRACVEVDCDEPGGTPWGPLWCARHDAERIQRVEDRLRELVRPSDKAG